MKKQTVGVLGIGEVGLAISKILESKFTVLKKDLKFDELQENRVEVLHICIPYSKKFIKTSVEQIEKNSPSLVVINSTVEPGTSLKVSKRVKSFVVHSPVMGLHPTLKKDILRFKKIVGPTSKESYRVAKKHFDFLNIKTVRLNSSLESEIGKLLDTNYYAWNIIFSKIVGEICKSHNISYENVYKKFNKIYNEGYAKTKPNAIRPILEYKDEPIGGHCLIPNAVTLNNYEKNTLTDLVLRSNNKLKRKEKIS